MYSNSFTGSFNEKLKALIIETILNKTHKDGTKFVTTTPMNKIVGNTSNECFTPILCTKNEKPKNDTKNDTIFVSWPK